MIHGRFVTGTGTDVGKTMVSSLLALKFNAHYFKPIQSGTPTDSDFLRHVIGPSRVYKEVYLLEKPLSPNQAAVLEGMSIDLRRISIADKIANHLIVEGVGGILSPINEQYCMIDVIAHLNIKTIVVARSGLGTITHTLQTIAILEQRSIEVSSIIFFGEPNAMNKYDIAVRTDLPVYDFHEIKNCRWENI